MFQINDFETLVPGTDVSSDYDISFGTDVSSDYDISLGTDVSSGYDVSTDTGGSTVIFS